MISDYLLVTYSDVVENAKTDFNKWYNDVHLPDFVACPGFLAASRYESLQGEPTFLAIYHMENPGALATPEVKRVWGWGPMAPYLRNAHGRAYRRTKTLGRVDAEASVPATPADFVLVTSSDVVSGAEQDFNAWYDDIHLPDILECPGFLSASRYECDDGEPRFLAIYDLDRPDALETPEMKRVHGWGPVAPRMRNFHGRIYQRTLTIEAP
jgi:hypothetical protein